MLHMGKGCPPAAQVAIVALAVGAMAAPGRATARELESSYLFRLADTNGAIPMSWAGLSYDRAARELYVNDRSAGEVRVFRESGMQVQSFGGDEAFGTILDVAVLDGGDLAVLTFNEKRTVVLRCDFRGQPIEPIELTGVPEPFATRFSPSAMRHVAGKLYLADRDEMKVLVVDERGVHQAAYELLPRLKLDSKRRNDGRMNGFAVDGAGNILFTVAPLFRAFVLSPDGELRAFGTRGSAPGRFNVVGAIAADERGYLYLTDILRAVVMVFDPSLEFVGEFGYRGSGAENLVAPIDLAVSDGQVFVAQGAMRGVSVFRVAIRNAAAAGRG
jgi:hypothetical protein